MKKKLLVVDDEDSIGLIIEINFSDNYEIIHLKNGREALDWLYAGNMPEAIVADLNMPLLNGFEFLKTMRSSAFYKNVPVIILSSDETSAMRIACFEAGADDYLIKPFNPRELELRIERIIKWLTFQG